MIQPSRLDDRDYAAFAWGRYRRILRWMTLAALVTALACLGLLEWSSGPLPWLFAVMAFVGVFATVMMAAALMGLVFLSNGTGHDAAVSEMHEDFLPHADDWEKEPD